MRKESTIEEINNLYRKRISDKWSNETLNKCISTALKYNRPSQLKLAFINFSNSKFWKKYENKYPSWILDRKRLSILRNMTCNLGQEYFNEIKEIEKLFVKYYNSFILHNYQEQMIYRPFISYDEFSDDIKKVSSFIIINNQKMYNIIEEEIPYEKLVFIFTAILFQIFEEPPHIFQYFKDDDKFWIWFKEKAPECYDLYSYWIKWSWMKEPKELRFGTNEIEEYHNERKKHMEAEQNSVKWHEITFQFESIKTS